MITPEQIKLLETRVSRAVEYIGSLQAENSKLKAKLIACEKHIGELEILVRDFKNEQSRIEDGILSALDSLNRFEDAVSAKLGPAVESVSAAEASADAGKAVDEAGADEEVASDNEKSPDIELDIF